MLDLDYTFDNVGNILTAKHNVGGGGLTTYTYDDLNRLMSATATLSNTYTRSWSYTPVGNTQTRNDGGGNLTYTYDPTVRSHAVKQIGSNYFCYDNNGNMTRRNSNAACTTGDSMSYDVENRMTSMTVGTTTTTFKYNGDGTRVARTTSAGTTYYVGNHYEIYDPVSGTTTFNKYYYFGTNRIAARINGTLFYMQADHLGSSSLVMTSGGALNTRQTYYPYGAKRVFDGSALPTDYTFTGQKSDDSTGLMFYGARYYDTTIGRFTQADSIIPNVMDPQAFNRYSYVNNNPVRYVDPTGHYACDDTDCTPGDVNGTGNGTRQDQPNPPAVPAPTTNGSNQNPDADAGGSCWLRCNRDDEADAQAHQDSSKPTQPQVARGSPGNWCMRCQMFGNESYDIGPDPDGTRSGGSNGAIGAGGMMAAARWVAEHAEELASGVARVPANLIRFTQDSISWATSKGVPLDTLTQEIGSVRFKGTIDVVQKDGVLWSLDNRRLAAFKLLDETVPVTVRTLSDPAVLADWNRKFTTVTDGLSTMIRNTDIVIR